MHIQNSLPSRPTWHEYFLKMAILVSERSTCIRRQVGAVIEKDHYILGTGYNGAPKGYPHCQDNKCIRKIMNVPSGEKHELCNGVHAEQNAIVQASKMGISIDGSNIYCTNKPCIICLKMIINAGIKNIYYMDGYEDKLIDEFIKHTNICIVKMRNPLNVTQFADPDV